MKNYLILLFIISICYSCKQEEKTGNRTIVVGDTITTESGLKYIFLKEGSGRRITANSKVQVYTDLYLNDSDSIFWSTETEKDSVFEFFHGATSLIIGFEELNSYLAEGDEVIAILPDSLAYGKDGGNGMPPATTLVYNPLIVKKVSEPKKIINDTLKFIIESRGYEAAIDFYQNRRVNNVIDDYHTDTELIIDLLDSLIDKEMYSETEKLAVYFGELPDGQPEQETFAYYNMISLEKQGKIKEALKVVEKELGRTDSNLEWWKDKKVDLGIKLDSIMDVHFE